MISWRSYSKDLAEMVRVKYGIGVSEGKIRMILRYGMRNIKKVMEEGDVWDGREVTISPLMRELWVRRWGWTQGKGKEKYRRWIKRRNKRMNR